MPALYGGRPALKKVDCGVPHQAAIGKHPHPIAARRPLSQNGAQRGRALLLRENFEAGHGAGENGPQRTFHQELAGQRARHVGRLLLHIRRHQDALSLREASSTARAANKSRISRSSVSLGVGGSGFGAGRGILLTTLTSQKIAKPTIRNWMIVLMKTPRFNV